MSTDIHNPNIPTNAPQAEVFAQVVDVFRRRGHKAEDITHLESVLESIKDHPGIQKKSAAAIETAVSKAFESKGREHDAGKNVSHLFARITRLSGDDITSNLPNLGDGKVAVERPHVVEGMRERAKHPTPKVTEPKMQAKNYGMVDHVSIGVSAILAALMLADGISGLIKSSKPKNEDDPQARPSSVMMSCINLLLGAGCAVLAHHQYKNPVGSQRG